MHFELGFVGVLGCFEGMGLCIVGVFGLVVHDCVYDMLVCKMLVAC